MYIYIYKCLKIRQIDVTKKNIYIQKKSSERYQNLSEEEKKREYSRERYTNLSQNEN